MARLFGAFVLVISVTLAATSVGQEQDVARGDEAYQRGDYEAAIREWLALAEQDNAEAQYKLGLMYRRGLGVERDYLEAVRWYREAASLGHAKAQFNLGYMYAKGHGVTKENRDLWMTSDR